MAYLQSSAGEPIPEETIRAWSRAIDLPIPEEDLEPLATALRDQLASMRSIEALDLNGVMPLHRFDPRWHD
jgi:hypothetical protein